LEFCRRISDHVLPKGMQRVRYSGLLHTSNREERLNLCRRLIEADKKTESHIETTDSASLLPSPEAIEAYEPMPHEATCPKCDRPRKIVNKLEPRLTHQVLSLVTLMLGTAAVLAGGVAGIDWRRAILQVIEDQRHVDQRHPIIDLVYHHQAGPDHPLFDYVRIRYEDQRGQMSPRAPPTSEPIAA